MPKKSLPTQIRPMVMFQPLNRTAPTPQTEVEDKDDTIRKLRASLALLEAENIAREEAKKAATRASVAKWREKKRAKPPSD